MASNFNKALKNRRITYVVQIAPFKQSWYGFTLQRNHVYGYSKPDNIHFVFKGIKGQTMVLHRRHIENGDYRWREYRIALTSPLGQAIARAVSERPEGIIYPSAEKQVKTFYNPPIVTHPFMPMPHMRIPGGAYDATTYYVERAPA